MNMWYITPQTCKFKFKFYISQWKKQIKLQLVNVYLQLNLFFLLRDVEVEFELA